MCQRCKFREEENSWQKNSVKKGSKGQEKSGKGENRACWICGETGHIAMWCRNGENKKLYAFDEDDSEHTEEALHTDEELQEESEHEQWQQVIRRRDKHKR